MRSAMVVVFVMLLAAGTGMAEDGFEGRPITENAYAPTGYTLHGGEFAIGIGPIAFGVTENVQVGTNLLLWAIQFYNADVKAALIETDDHAVAVGVGLGSLQLDIIDEDADADFTIISPYAAGSLRIGENTMWHIGGQYSHFDTDSDADVDDAEAIGSLSGTNFFTGIEHSYSNRTKFVFDAGYDATFEGARVSGAVLFGWTKFRLKLGISYFAVGDGFTWPLVGLWWRFGA